MDTTCGFRYKLLGFDTDIPHTYIKHHIPRYYSSFNEWSKLDFPPAPRLSRPEVEYVKTYYNLQPEIELLSRPRSNQKPVVFNVVMVVVVVLFIFLILVGLRRS